MSSRERLDRWHRSVAVRLSLWFALLFAAGFSAIFAFMYWTLGRQLEAREERDLNFRLDLYASIYRTSGARGLQLRLQEDSNEASFRSLYIRIDNPRDGTSFFLNVPPHWISEEQERRVVPDGWGGVTEERTISVRAPLDSERDLVGGARGLHDGRRLVMARATENRTVLLEPLRGTFLWVGGGVLVLGFVAGLLAARRATRPLRDVIATAQRIIATGELDARVPLPRRHDEVADLVRAFNTVLDKNAGLVRSMRESLDNVAHDLRTPLTRLRGTAELALRSGGGAGGASGEALANCVEQADDVLRLLRALMEISEAEAGMLRLERAACDLGSLARDAADLYAEVAEARRVRLRVEAPRPLPVTGDHVRLRQAMANLVDNAIKYTPEGGEVVVSALASANEAVFSVRDSGAGVPEADREKIWERLYRGDASRSQRGLGLGLSLVRAIVTAHGGRVAQRNAPEGGAVFEIAFPLGR